MKVHTPNKKKQASGTKTEAPSLRIVGIGASAGGLEAFTELLRSLRAQPGAAYVLVQHLDPTHRSLLSELLGRATTLPVREIVDGTAVEANHIYVIPPNTDLDIRGGVLKLTPRKSNGPARSIDHFLQSLAQDQKEKAIGVILSGAGSDGAKGLKAIKAAGGITFAQDTATSKYDSMPRSAVGMGCVDFVLPPARIASEIARLLSEPGATRSRAAANARNRRGTLGRPKPRAPLNSKQFANWPAAPEDLNLRKIFLLLRSKMGLDFSLYRPSTMRRRLTRRLMLHKIKDLEGYLRLLRENPGEIEALYQDLLIGVTSFFRNGNVFEVLKKKVFPELVKNQGNGDTLRMWIAGCSTGQEAYSLAMAYVEFAERSNLPRSVQIFATDVNAAVLEQARAGLYNKSQVTQVTEKRLVRFFQKENDAWRVRKEIRDMVVFAQQNLLTDPPFTRVDLISCRNMLIYLEPALQQKIIPSFHYALKTGGCLVLGASESVGQFNHLFESQEKAQKIYRRKPGSSWLHLDRNTQVPSARPVTTGAPVTRPAEFSVNDAFREADRLMLSRYAPPSVLVNESGDVLQFRGDLRKYLELPAGKATLHLLKMARGGLSLVLQRALTRARKESRAVREKEVRVDGRRGYVTIEVAPLRNLKTSCFLVTFEKTESAAKVTKEKAAPGMKGPGKPSREEARRITEMRREFAETREQLDVLREEHETSVEELQASNEEVQSANEELQSLNEELETSNEELESANEELTTLNEELATRNTELAESEQRLREQAELLDMAPALARSPRDRIIFWNRGTERLYGFSKEEAIGQIAHLLLSAQFPEPLEKIVADLHRHGHWEGEVWHRRKDGQAICVASQWVMHHDAQGKVRAILEVNTDITARKKAETSLHESEEFNKRILESSPDCITVLDLAGRVVFMTPRGKELMGNTEAEIASTFWPGFWKGEDRAKAEAAYRAALTGEAARFEAANQSSDGSHKWWDVVILPILGEDERPERLLATAREITGHKLSTLATEAEARLSTMRAAVAVEVARSGEVKPLLQKIAEVVVRQFENCSVKIWTHHNDGGNLKLQASAGSGAHFDDSDGRVEIGAGLIGRIADSHKAVLADLEEASAEFRDGLAAAKREGVVAFAGFPLLFQDHLLGVMAVWSQHRIDRRIMQELGQCANVVAHFLERKNNEDERTQLYREATTARNDALAASRAKDDFLAALSHELRTPLNPVLLLASEGAEDETLTENVRSIFRTIRNNVKLEARLIDDLLDLTRIARGKLTLEMKPTDVHLVLQEVVTIVSPEIKAKELHFTQRLRAKETIVIGDSVRLQQVFWNVLKNAVKFTPVGGSIAIESSVRGSGHKLAIRVTDSGIGLADGDHERIFDAFSQAEHRRGGLGLGLAISRRLLENMGGSIRAKSEGPGKGSTFEIDLPLAEGVKGVKVRGIEDELSNRQRLPVARDGHAVPTAFTSKRRCILLIEDHAPTRTTMQALLKRRNFDVIAASTAEEARSQLQRGKPDLVISDLGLPDGDGCALFAELRKSQPDLIGVALSGYGMDDDIARSLAAGFSAHLTKPIDMDALARAIEKLLEIEDAANRVTR